MGRKVRKISEVRRERRKIRERERWSGREEEGREEILEIWEGGKKELGDGKGGKRISKEMERERRQNREMGREGRIVVGWEGWERDQEEEREDVVREMGGEISGREEERSERWEWWEEYRGWWILLFPLCSPFAKICALLFRLNCSREPTVYFYNMPVPIAWCFLPLPLPPPLSS
jgi:hypothetical protein